ncbi:Fic family protein [Roseateles agri]|nr:DUF4172 domain-containing protein [Paucibacter sp. R3-3]
MSSKPLPWTWQQSGWPNLTFSYETVAADLSAAHRMKGIIEGKAAAIGLTKERQVSLDAMVDEVQATAAIEGERLPMDAVRSSVMRRLGLDSDGPVQRDVDGLVAVLNDATEGYEIQLDDDRLCRWQSALFPGGTSGLSRIAVGRYRVHEDPMQIVSGRPGKEVVRFQAPPSGQVPQEMRHFLVWFENTRPAKSTVAGQSVIDGLARAAIAHLWFESIHPFEDGNGRLGRAIVDMAVAQHLKQPIRMYSLSRQLLSSRAA